MPIHPLISTKCVLPNLMARPEEQEGLLFLKKRSKKLLNIGFGLSW